MKKEGYIYCLSDPDTQEIRYIGQTTRSLKVRLNEHLSKKEMTPLTYKRNWIKSILDNGKLPLIEEIDKVDNKELDFWEEHYISLYKSWGLKLTNLCSGGNSASNTTEVVNKIRASGAYERLRLRNLTDKNPAKRISVLQFDLEGNFIRKWDSMITAAKGVGNQSTSGLRAACTGLQKTSGGFKWKFTDEKYYQKMKYVKPERKFRHLILN